MVTGVLGAKNDRGYPSHAFDSAPDGTYKRSQAPHPQEKGEIEGISKKLCPGKLLFSDKHGTQHGIEADPLKAAFKRVGAAVKPDKASAEGGAA